QRACTTAFRRRSFVTRASRTCGGAADRPDLGPARLAGTILEVAEASERGLSLTLQRLHQALPALAPAAQSLGCPHLGGGSRNVAVEAEEVVDPPDGHRRIGAEVLEPDEEVARAECPLTEFGSHQVHAIPERDRADRLPPAHPAFEHDGAVLHELLLVVGE